VSGGWLGASLAGTPLAEAPGALVAMATPEALGAALDAAVGALADELGDVPVPAQAARRIPSRGIRHSRRRVLELSSTGTSCLHGPGREPSASGMAE
jgi:hypothetical protein